MGTSDIADGAAQAPAVRWLFAGYMLDESTLQLSRDGRLLPIERKPLEALLFMLQHSGEVVTKEELLAAVWPGRILSDTALAKCISRLREVLGDHNQSLIKTAHGYGYRFAGSPRTELITREAPPLLAELKPGDHPPLRPLWTLEERIGSGGGGDTWRVRHDKTGEVRVFKFARDPVRLIALKREITLYRLIKNTLEDEAPIVTLLDWNLVEAPYFVESRLANGGSLSDWWKAVGGAAAVSLEERIELIAKIADGLAAIHSIGVLHKDLKPSNVLLELAADGRPLRLLLGDLGSGGLSDPDRVQSMGVTRMGFTRSVINPGTTSGTPMYLAPEVLMGQPPTIQADLYALGIMLYQILIGDFSQPIAAGWERRIDNEILREDIALFIDGNADARPADGGELARRLRSVFVRLDRRREERQTKTRAELALRALERAQARRFGLSIAVVALILGFTATSALYLDARGARAKAESETQHAEAINDFLSRDMFSAVSSDDRSVRGLSVEDLLDSAATEIDRRFSQSPSTAAELHAVLGRSYRALQLDVKARDHLLQALAYYEKRDGLNSPVTVKLAVELLPLTYSTGTIELQLPRFKAIVDASADAANEVKDALLPLQREVARTIALQGDWVDAVARLRRALDMAGFVSERDKRLDIGLTRLLLGHLLDNLAEYRDGEVQLRLALASIEAIRGPIHQDVASARLWLGHVLLMQGRLGEAESEFSRAESIARAWSMDNSGHLSTANIFRMELALARRRPSQAIDIGVRELAQYLRQKDSKLPDASWVFREPLAVAYRQSGDLPKAAEECSAAMQSVLATDGPNSPETWRITVLAAEIALDHGQASRARELLAPLQQKMDAQSFPENHPIRVSLRQASERIGAMDGSLYLRGVKFMTKKE